MSTCACARGRRIRRQTVDPIAPRARRCLQRRLGGAGFHQETVMPHVLILDFPGGSPAQYDQVTERMGLHGVLPEGALAHLASATDAGLRVCDVWSSPEAFGRFAEAWIMPLSAEVGLPHPEIRQFPAHRWHRERDTPPTFAQVVRLPETDLATFDDFDARIRPDGGWPDGMIWHSAGGLEGDVY